MLRISIFLLSLAIGNCFAQSQEKEILYFEYARHSFTEESRKTVDLLLQRTSWEKIVEVSLSGHTDSDGSDSSNMKLSRERVAMVQRYLIERGVSQNKIRKYYYGKTRPIASNATTGGKQKNRRVEIMLVVSTSVNQPSNEVANADTEKMTSSELPCSSIIHQSETKVLYFNSGKHELTTSSLQVILDELEKLRNFHLVRIELAGHTDSDGPETLNMNLSKERADIVERYLLSRNVPFSKINSSYFGEGKPISSNATGEGKRKNRRVEMLIRYDECASDDHIIVTSQEETTSKKIKEHEVVPLKTTVSSTPGQEKHEVTTNKLETNDTKSKQAEVEPVKDTPIQKVESSVKTDSATDEPERIEPLVTANPTETGSQQQKTDSLATKKTQQPVTVTNLTDKIQTVDNPVTSTPTSTQPLSVEPTVQIQEVSRKDTTTVITPVTSAAQTIAQEVKPKTEISNADTISNTVKHNDVKINNEPILVNNLAPTQPTTPNSIEESKNPTAAPTQDSTTNQPVTTAQELILKTETSNTDTISNTVKHNDVKINNEPILVNNLAPTQPTTPNSIGESKNPTAAPTQDSTTNQPVTTAKELIPKTEISNTDTISNTVKHNDVKINNEPTPVNNLTSAQPNASTNSANSIGESKNPTVAPTQDSTTNQAVTTAQELIPKTETSNTDTISNTLNHNDVQVNNVPTPVINLTPTQPTTSTNSANSIGESKNPTVVPAQDSTTNQPVLLAKENTQTTPIPSTTPVKKDSIIHQPPPIERNIAEVTEVKNVQLEVTIEKDSVKSTNNHPPTETIKKDTLVQTQSHTVLPNEALTITGDKGTIITFPGNSLVDKNGNPVTGDVTVNLEEVYNKSDMITHGVQTSSDGKLLESGGMVQVQIATKDSSTVFLKPGSAYKIQYPTEKKKEDMQLFTGNSSGQNWEPVGKNDSTFNENKQSLDKYIFRNSKMGWTNVDRFMGLNDSHRSNLKVGLAGTGTPDASVCLVFKKINSVLNITNRKSEFMFYNIPTGEEVTLVAFAKSGDQVLYASKNITVSKNQNEHLTLETLSEAEFQQRIKEFN